MSSPPTEPMRVLMLGWEFPPFITGGLGTACHGLARALNRRGVAVTFVLPRAVSTPEDPRVSVGGRVEPPGPSLRVRPVAAGFESPYEAPEAEAPPPRFDEPPRRHALHVVGAGGADGYAGDLVAKIRGYAERCAAVAAAEPFDVIHAHDWMTFPAAEAAAEVSGKAVVAHVHATEFDRRGEGIDPRVYAIERAGMAFADRVVAVSHLTRRTLVSRYGIAPEKVTVVHNGTDRQETPFPATPPHGPEKTVLFLGRLTMQKGPSYFLDAASRVLRRYDNVRFLVAGWGDLATQMMEEVRRNGLSEKIQFVGFLRGQAVQRAFRMADVYVMPSVSEPFGLTALEAIHHGVPVVLSKTSGVAEVLPRGAVKVDFWNTAEMANRIVSLLTDDDAGATLHSHAAHEANALSWDKAAEACFRVYDQARRELSASS